MIRRRGRGNLRTREPAEGWGRGRTGALSTFQRARRPEQKAQRRAAILEAARALAAERGVAEVTLTEVASSVGLAKSNVLRYFETREDVYLHLLVAEWKGFETVVAGSAVAQPQPHRR